MKPASTALARELPSLAPQRVKRLIENGIRDRRHMEDVIRGVPDGGRMLAEFLELSEQKLIEAMGWTRWPENTGVTLSGPCPLGVLEPTADMLAPTEPSHAGLAPAELPDHASLIDRYGPPVSQGSVGTCPSFAAVAVVEGQHRPRIDLSERFNYALTKEIDGHPDTDGSYLRFSTRVLTEYGACPELTWPYVEDRDALRQRPPDGAFEEAAAYRVPSGPIRLTPTNSAAIRSHIATGHPVAVSVPIHRSTMFSLRFHGEGRFNMKLGLLDTPNGHQAMCIVAYLDNSYLARNDFPDEVGGGAFLLRNSWGPAWARNNPLAKHLGGEGGHAIMPYRYIEEYCFEAYTAVVGAGVRRGLGRSLGDGVRGAGASWWRRTRDAVVTQARQRLAELKQ